MGDLAILKWNGAELDVADGRPHVHIALPFCQCVNPFLTTILNSWLTASCLSFQDNHRVGSQEPGCVPKLVTLFPQSKELLSTRFSN